MKTFNDDLDIGDEIVDIPNSKNPDKPIRYRVLGIEYDEAGRPVIEVERIDPENAPPRLAPWAIGSAVVAAILTYLLLA